MEFRSASTEPISSTILPVVCTVFSFAISALLCRISPSFAFSSSGDAAAERLADPRASRSRSSRSIDSVSLVCWSSRTLSLVNRAPLG
jgi:hypothetical protein